VSAPLAISDFDFELPAECIAQAPSPERDEARLMLVDRGTGATSDGVVRDLADQLREGDLLVMNATRVEPARLRGRKATGGKAEALLLGSGAGPGHFDALVKMRGRVQVGAKLTFERHETVLEAEIVSHADDGTVGLAFEPGADPYAIGEMPLPPYIERLAADAADQNRYQTVYAREPGSVAAPTAGLHLTDALLGTLKGRGVELAEVVLHVGVGTFRPVTEDAIRAGELHPERYELDDTTADAIERTRARGGRVAAVGTTTTRVLEHASTGDGRVRSGRGETRLFIRPGDGFEVVDALLTNFHLPRSSLLMLVAAFAGRERILAAYREAVARGYRFYSYGDAMWIS